VINSGLVPENGAGSAVKGGGGGVAANPFASEEGTSEVRRLVAQLLKAEGRCWLCWRGWLVRACVRACVLACVRACGLFACRDSSLRG